MTVSGVPIVKYPFTFSQVCIIVWYPKEVDRLQPYETN